MTSPRCLTSGLLLLAGSVASSLAGCAQDPYRQDPSWGPDPCQLTIESNDMMQYNTHQLAVPASCADVEITLLHAGKMPASTMGHDWVLTKDSDVAAVVDAGQAAGRRNGFVPQHDKRVIAAIKIVGSGESTTLKFGTNGLVRGERYAFFCTTPGHAATMRGQFVFGSAYHLARLPSSACTREACRIEQRDQRQGTAAALTEPAVPRLILQAVRQQPNTAAAEIASMNL